MKQLKISPKLYTYACACVCARDCAYAYTYANESFCMNWRLAYTWKKIGSHFYYREIGAKTIKHVTQKHIYVYTHIHTYTQKYHHLII